MDLIWTCPGKAPDPAAIARMRQHFPEPHEPMPEAWFMGDVNFYTPDPNGDQYFLRYQLEQIRDGTVNFPQVQYVPVWKEWFLYLLPDLILRVTNPENYDTYASDLLAITITTFFNLYPSQIQEEYQGFRHDVMSTLGTRATPTALRLMREREELKEKTGQLFVDVGNESGTVVSYDFPSYNEVHSSVLFCLKYLTPLEIEGWGTSLFQMNSPRWYLHIISVLAAWRKTITHVRDKTNEISEELQPILSQNGLLETYWHPAILTFDELIPPDHVAAFEQVINKHFSLEPVMHFQTNGAAH